MVTDPQDSLTNQAMNLSLDLYAIDCHAMEYMRRLGITYEHATPQSMGDCWWFWNCQNAPEPMPDGLSVLKITPHEAIGYGLSQEDATRLERVAESQKQKRQDSRRA